MSASLEDGESRQIVSADMVTEAESYSDQEEREGEGKEEQEDDGSDWVGCRDLRG